MMRVEYADIRLYLKQLCLNWEQFSAKKVEKHAVSLRFKLQYCKN